MTSMLKSSILVFVLMGFAKSSVLPQVGLIVYNNLVEIYLKNYISRSFVNVYDTY